jgi:hypothetical protein
MWAAHTPPLPAAAAAAPRCPMQSITAITHAHPQTKPPAQDANLPLQRLCSAYREMVGILRTLYQRCRLVHADLSEYNILVHQVSAGRHAGPCALAGRWDAGMAEPAAAGGERRGGDVCEAPPFCNARASASSVRGARAAAVYCQRRTRAPVKPLVKPCNANRSHPPTHPPNPPRTSWSSSTCPRPSTWTTPRPSTFSARTHAT